MNESTSRLLDAVDALTKPVVEHHRQTDDDGKFLGIHTVEHPPLLEQLRAAVNPSSNTAAGSASLASTRNLIDADALAKWSAIAGTVGVWCRAVDLPAHSADPVSGLRAWFPAFTRNAHGMFTDDWYTAELRRWAGQIRNLLDPPRRMECLFPCPVCKADVYVTESGETMRHPVVLEYRASDDGRVQRPRAVCRSVDCGATWESFDAIEELAQELGEKVNA